VFVRTQGNNSIRISSHNTTILSSLYKLSTSGNIVVLRLPYPYRIIALNTITFLQENVVTHFQRANHNFGKSPKLGQA